MADSPRVLAALQRFDEGDVAGAVAGLTAAIAETPDAADLYFYRAQVLAEAGDHSRALADFDRALTLDPAMGAGRQRRAETRVDAGDYAGAIADYSAILAASGDDAERRFDALTQRAQLYTLSQAPEAAIADFSAAIALEPAFFTLYHLRAQARLLGGDAAGAMADLDEGLRLYPDDAEALQTRARLRAAAGDADGARADLDAAIAVLTENEDPEGANRVDALRRELGLDAGA
jgi:tetratricopeptide (TPR) repeat protein